MVALNFQTPDLPKLMNIGRFLENGNCGYVLKPEQLRRVRKKASRCPEKYPIVFRQFSMVDAVAHDDGGFERTLRSSTGSDYYAFTRINLTVIGAFHLPKPSANVQAEVRHGLCFFPVC
jgi:hypothetical protein